MNIMTVESKHLYLQADQLKEHLDMANNLYQILSRNTKDFDHEVLGELLELKQVILEEKQELLKGVELTKQYIQKQNKENMDMVMQF